MASDLDGGAPAAGNRQASREIVPFEVAATPGEPVLRWDSAATTVAGVERELARIWSSPPARGALSDGERPSRVVAARSSVLNLVVVARRPELGERVVAEIATLTGRHPSRTLVLVPQDPDGPAWFRARIQVYCMISRGGSPETCSELVQVAAGGDAGRHLAAIVAPLLVHDLPVALWWPGDPPFSTRVVDDLVDLADRLIVDGSSWSGDGLDRVRILAGVARSIPVTDFAVARQARWREAIAAAFDRPDLLVYLRSLRRIAVNYSTRGGPGADASTNVVKPVYHVGWLASRLGLRPIHPLRREGARPSIRPAPFEPALGPGSALRGTLGAGSRRAVDVIVQPVLSTVDPGTTLRVELLAERRGRDLMVEVTAAAEVVRVRAWENGVEALDRPYPATRPTEMDLLAEAIETGAADHVALGALEAAAALVAPDGGL